MYNNIHLIAPKDKYTLRSIIIVVMYTTLQFSGKINIISIISIGFYPDKLIEVVGVLIKGETLNYMEHLKGLILKLLRIHPSIIVIIILMRVLKKKTTKYDTVVLGHSELTI